MSVLICIKTVRHPDSVPEGSFCKRVILKKSQQTTKKLEYLPSMRRVIAENVLGITPVVLSICHTLNDFSFKKLQSLPFDL